MELQLLLEQYIDPTIVAIIVICIMWLPTILPVPTEESNKFYTFVYKVINAISANIGRARNASTPPRSSRIDSKTQIQTLLVLLSISVLTLSGCALKTLEPHEQGVAITHELTQTYYALEEQYITLPEDTQDKIAPLLDKYRETLVLLRDSASLWYKTKTKPLDFDMLANSLTAILEDITVLVKGK